MKYLITLIVFVFNFSYTTAQSELNYFGLPKIQVKKELKKKGKIYSNSVRFPLNALLPDDYDFDKVNVLYHFNKFDRCCRVEIEFPNREEFETFMQKVLYDKVNIRRVEDDETQKPIYFKDRISLDFFITKPDKDFPNTYYVINAYTNLSPDFYKENFEVRISSSAQIYYSFGDYIY